MNNSMKAILITACLVMGQSLTAQVGPFTPDSDISKVGNILSNTQDPHQLKLYTNFKSDYRYTQNVLNAFKEAGQSLNTKTITLKGRPSLEFRPIERLVIHQLPYASRHPWRLAAKSSVLGAATMFGFMKANEAGYLEDAKKAIKNTFNDVTAKFFKK